MTVKDLEVLFDYGYWVNKHIFEVMAQLSAARRCHGAGHTKRILAAFLRERENIIVRGFSP